MKLRVARHTAQLDSLTKFYQRILNLEHLGAFENHVGYDGVFLGKSSNNWELELTSSADNPSHTFDEDDLLIFYVSKNELQTIRKNLAIYNVLELPPKNPYWTRMGIHFRDPDGYGIIVALEDKQPII